MLIIFSLFVCLGGLAAFVYQHSITPLALPIRLTMPSHGKSIFSDQISYSQELRARISIYSLKRNLVVVQIIFRLVSILEILFFLLFFRPPVRGQGSVY